jgi:microsomal dipeptidase-like Zn-dependent dipeptidase
MAILMGIEGGHAIDSDLSILGTYFNLGARYMTLTHSSPTLWADFSGKPPIHNVAGIDHVGLGSDFDGVDDQFPRGMEDISKIPNLVAGLVGPRLLGRRHPQGAGRQYAASDAGCGGGSHTALTLHR